MALADAGVEHAQEVVDLGDRADGRPRVVAGRLLRDRDRRAQAADVVDVGLGHLPQKLPGEGGQTLDVPPLPFGIERVERQRALARAGDAGQANQLVARQHNVDVAQVVLAGAFDDDIGSGHRCAVGWVQNCKLAFYELTADRKRRRFLPSLRIRYHPQKSRQIFRTDGMNATSNYELLDFGDGRKLERFGDVVLNRPCPAAEGVAKSRPELWDDDHGAVSRAADGRWLVDAGCRRRGCRRSGICRTTMATRRFG